MDWYHVQAIPSPLAHHRLHHPCRDHCRSPVPLQSLTATGNDTIPGHHLLNGFCGANRSATPFLLGRNQRPEGPASSIHLQVMANTCITGDITELRVSVNGQQNRMLGTSPGASGTFAGTSGGNSVTVVAKFGNGAESVVYEGVL